MAAEIDSISLNIKQIRDIVRKKENIEDENDDREVMQPVCRPWDGHE